MQQSNREIRLAEALVESADTLVEGFEAVHHLSRVAERCARLLAARSAGFMLIDGGRAVSLAAGGADREIALELLGAQHGGGPCLDCYGSGRPVPPVSIGAGREAVHWPEFTERALAHDPRTPFRCDAGSGCSARSMSSAPPTRRRCCWPRPSPTARRSGW